MNRRAKNPHSRLDYGRGAEKKQGQNYNTNKNGTKGNSPQDTLMED